MSNREFLKDVYGLETFNDTRDFYNEWAQTYDSEVGKQGYRTPMRCAKALARFVRRKTTPILDFGCGTGLSGAALAKAGFKAIDGVDISERMIGLAGKTQAYRSLKAIQPDDLESSVAPDIRHIAAVGVIGAGAAPPETLDQLIQVLPPKGYLVFSFNDHTLSDRAFEARLNENIDAGVVEMTYNDYGEHLPGLSMNSMVYALRKR